MRLAPRPPRIGWPPPLVPPRPQPYTRRPFPSERSVTVCVAAICENGRTIIGASDRMLTAGEITEFQSPERKVHVLTTSIVAMWSGDSDFVRGIFNPLKAEIDARVAAAPGEWLDVRETANLFQEQFNHARSALIEQEVLAPFGLTMASFRKSQRSMDPAFVQDLLEQVRSCPIPGISVMIVGIDRTGAHIYEFENIYSRGRVHCHDAIGFHAIGIGGWHARSQLMMAKYGPSRPLAETLFHVYAAKKRAEIAPGVGTLTDMFLFVPRPPAPSAYYVMAPEGKAKIHAIYERMASREGKAATAAIAATNEWIKSLTPAAPPQGQASGPIITGTGEVTLGGLSVTATGTVTPPGATGPTGPTGPQAS
jgi:hypothetical protein